MLLRASIIEETNEHFVVFKGTLILGVIVSGVLLFPFDPFTLTICSNPSCSSSKGIEKTGYVENIVRQGVANRVLF